MADWQITVPSAPGSDVGSFGGAALAEPKKSPTPANWQISPPGAADWKVKPPEGGEPNIFERWLTEQGIAKPGSPVARGEFLKGMGESIKGAFQQPSILDRAQDIRRREEAGEDVKADRHRLAEDIALGFGGAMEVKRGISPATEAPKGIPTPQAKPSPAPTTPAEGPKPGDVAVGAPNVSRETLPQEPILKPPVAGEKPKGFAGRLDEAFYKKEGADTADKMEISRLIDETPRQLLNPALDEKAYAEVEQRMLNPKAELSEDVKPLVEKGERFADESHEAITRIREKLGKKFEDMVELPTYREGYVHRIRKGVGGWLDRLDPENMGQATDPLGRGRRSAGLSRKAPGNMPRQFFVLEGPNGVRTTPKTRDQLRQELRSITKRGGEGKAPKDLIPGKSYRGTDGKSYTLKNATTPEIEARYPEVRYHKRFLLNTLDNWARLRRVERNIDLLNDLKPQLESSNLWIAADSKEAPPKGFVRVDVPVLDGWAHPEIAHTINDHVGLHRGNILEGLEDLNSALTRTLFLLPIKHMLNISAYWYTGRGWEWVKPHGYWSIAKNGIRALASVVRQDQLQQQIIERGGALAYPPIGTRNLYELMLRKAGGEIERDPRWQDIAKQVGMSPVNLVKAIYSATNKTLWAYGDILLTQRVLELQDRGVPLQQAIERAHQEMPIYRVPSQVMGSRAVSQVIKSPLLFMFGRYHYDFFRVIAQMIKPFVSKLPVAEKADAVGKWMAFAFAAYVIWPYADKFAQQLSGNPNAKFQRFGLYTIPYAFVDMEQGTREWYQALATLMTPAPGTLAVMEAVGSGLDPMGRKIIDPNATMTGKVFQGAEFLLDKIWPIQQAMQMMKPGGAQKVALQQIGISQPSQVLRKPGAIKSDIRRARMREIRDPLEQMYIQDLQP